MRREILEPAALRLDISDLPGADLVIQGIEDLREGVRSEFALLVLMACPRLRDLGIEVPDMPDVRWPVEHRFYELLEDKFGADGYSRYNSLRRRIVSFVHALEHRRSARPGE